MAIIPCHRLPMAFLRRSCLLPRSNHLLRSFTTSTDFRAEKPLGALDDISRIFGQPARRREGTEYGAGSRPFTGILDQDTLDVNQGLADLSDFAAEPKAHRLHVYATKHNTHITLVQPPKSAADTLGLGSSKQKASGKVVDTLLSLSAGNLGFRKAGRGSFDAAFQLAAFTLKTIQERGFLRDIQALEVVLRGFGAGREAVTKAILGTEGRIIRERISVVMDSTRLKQGGPRSKAPRRLG